MQWLSLVQFIQFGRGELLLAGPAVVAQWFMQQQRRLSPGSLDAG
jgi:hypothetical protein